MAIVIERTITVKNDKSTLDSPLYLYVGDGDIIYLFTIKEMKKAATFGTINTSNSITEDKSYGEIRIYKPNDELAFTTRAEIIDDKLQALFSYEDIDQLDEAGIHQLQIHLYDDDDSVRNRFTIPPIELNVLLPVGTSTSLVDEAIAGYAEAKVSEPIDTFLEDGSYNKTVWTTGDKITSGKLNKIEDALYQINAGNTTNDDCVTSQELSSALANKADKTHTHSEYTSKSYVINAINNAQLGGVDGSGLDLSIYATKDELANKANVSSIPTKTSQLTNDNKYISSLDVIRIEVVDELPETEEDGVLYIVKSE